MNFFTLKTNVERGKETLMVTLKERKYMLTLFSGITITYKQLLVESYHDVPHVEIALGEIFNLVDHDLHSLLVRAVVLPVLDNKYI